MMVFGNQIKSGRALAGLNQTELARAAGITRQALVNMEGAGADRVTSRGATVARVAAALGARNVMMVPSGCVRIDGASLDG
jgi:DNA-binding XRE family transcriptional regulator